MLANDSSGVPGNWRKARASSGQDGCIEVGESAGRIHVRDTKDRGGPVLSFTADQWRAFSDRVKDA